MKIVPGQIPVSLPATSHDTSARDKAVAAFQTGQASPEAEAKFNQMLGRPETPSLPAPTPAPRMVQKQETPVSNPNAITAEELTAIQPESGQNPVDETPVQEVTPEPKSETPSVSSQMQILARKERALRAKAQQQDQAFKAREAELARREKELADKGQTQQWDPTQYVPKSRLKQETLQVLAEEGMSYDDLVAQLVNQQPANPRYEALLNKQNEQIQKLTAQLEAQQKAAQEAQDVQYKAAIKQIETDVMNQVRKDPNFETIRHTRSQKDVVELIERTFKEEGYIMSVEDACLEVENYLVDEASKLARIDKIQKRIAPKPAAQPPSQTQTPAPQQKQTMKTLTNQVGSTRKLTARERAIRRAEGYQGDF